MFCNEFLTFEPTFGMMSCLTLQLRPCIPLCFMCESAHRLRDLLSTLQICGRVVHDILNTVLSMCETVFIFLRDHCPNCRTVMPLGSFIMLHLVFYSCSSTLDLSFFMELFSICEPLLCHFDPSWWSRHIDCQVYIIKLQPGFCHANFSQQNSHFWANCLHDVLSNFEITTLCPPAFTVWVGTSTSRPPVDFANL